MPASRGNTVFDAALYAGVDRRAQRRRRQAGVALPARAGRVARPRRGVRARARRRRRPEAACSRSARPASCGSSIARTAQFLGFKETVFQNVFDRIDPKTGVPTYRADIIEQQVEQWIQSCPSTEGGHNWQAMSYHQPTNALIIPLSQSCMEMIGPRRSSSREGARRHRRGSPVLRDARVGRQRRQAGRLRRRRR